MFFSNGIDKDFLFLVHKSGTLLIYEVLIAGFSHLEALFSLLSYHLKSFRKIFLPKKNSPKNSQLAETQKGWKSLKRSCYAYLSLQQLSPVVHFFFLLRKPEGLKVAGI